MIEREINLLAPRIIKVRAYRIYLERFGHLVRFAMFLSCLLLVVIGSAYVVVWWSEKSLMNTDGVNNERVAASVAEVRRINAQLVAVKAWQSATRPWTVRLPELFKVMPADIALTSIGTDETTEALELRGTFTRRESLVLFQRQLEALPWVEAVEAPLSNFETGSGAEWQLRVVRQSPKPSS